jgi:putative transposase
MSEYIHKSHNMTVLLYHLVFPAKYRRAVFDNRVDEVQPYIFPTTHRYTG